MDAFISYRRKPSSSLALLLQTKLKADYKIDAYVDTTRADGNQIKFPERLMQAIVEKEVFVCILGDTTLDSEWVIKEIEQAFRYQKRCVPVFQESYVEVDNPSEAINYLLSFDGVHIFDVKNVYVDEAVSQIAQLIKGKRRFNPIPFLTVVGLIILLLIGAYNIYPFIQANPTEEQTEIIFEPTETNDDTPKATDNPNATETATDSPTSTYIPTTRPTMTANQYYDRADSTYNAKNYEAALADYSRAIELDPNYAIAYSGRGDTYRALRDYEAALADYSRAIELDPNYANGYSGRGDTYRALRDYEAALADCNRAIELDPNYANGYNCRGNTYYYLGDYEAALADCNHAIEIDVNFVLGYNCRGNAYSGLEDHEAALADYSRAIELDPNYAIAYFNRGLTYYDVGNYEASLADWIEAERLGYSLPELTVQRVNELRATITPNP